MSQTGIDPKYTPDNLHHMNKQLLHELVKELHEAVIGLLWQIDDLKHHDELMWESHFDQTIPHEHAQRLHRLLMTRHPKEVMKFYPSGDYQEFDDWWHRCQVSDSFVISVGSLAKPLNPRKEMS